MPLTNHPKKLLVVVILVLSVAAARIITLSPQQPQTEPISAAEAANHIGEVQTVCGEVASVTYARESNGQPTFINLEEPYPNHIFTIVIWGDDRYKFEQPPEEYYANKEICVTGRIEEYEGKPQIIVSGSGEIIINNRNKGD